MNAASIFPITYDDPGRNEWERHQDMIQAVRALYLVSSAAAQLGRSGLEVTASQWHGLLECTRRARAVIDQADVMDASGLCRTLRELVLVCEEILEQGAPGMCSPSLWRSAGRIGREAYECAEGSITGAST
jgi:hypothetical protein